MANEAVPQIGAEETQGGSRRVQLAGKALSQAKDMLVPAHLSSRQDRGTYRNIIRLLAKTATSQPSPSPLIDNMSDIGKVAKMPLVSPI